MNADSARASCGALAECEKRHLQAGIHLVSHFAARSTSATPVDGVFFPRLGDLFSLSRSCMRSASLGASVVCLMASQIAVCVAPSLPSAAFLSGIMRNTAF
jgi:hypothetical protein